jgi:4-hydroxybenzoate polyprenyltransferase
VVFAGILFAQKLLDPAVIVPVAGLFASFCCAASCVYLFNDIRDREEDAQHPVKCHRPIASGQLKVSTAWGMAIGLALLAFAIVTLMPRPEGVAEGFLPPGVIALSAYLLLNIAYTTALKSVVIADVSCVALGFLIRVVSGPAVAGLEVSSWLILCTFFGALFLAVAKRRGELFTTDGGGKGRSVLEQYSDVALDIFLAMTATATMLAYSIYTVAPETVDKLQTRNLFYTIPIVFYGLGRYVILLYRRGKGEDPAAVLFTDRGLLTAIATWLAVSVTILGLAQA